MQGERRKVAFHVKLRNGRTRGRIHGGRAKLGRWAAMSGEMRYIGMNGMEIGGCTRVRRVDREDGGRRVARKKMESGRGREITSSSIVCRPEGCKHLISHSNSAAQSDPLLLKRHIKRPALLFRTKGAVDGEFAILAYHRCSNGHGQISKYRQISAAERTPPKSTMGSISAMVVFHGPTDPREHVRGIIIGG